MESYYSRHEVITIMKEEEDYEERDDTNDKTN